MEARLNFRMDPLENRMNSRMDTFEGRVDNRIYALEKHMGLKETQMITRMLRAENKLDNPTEGTMRIDESQKYK